MCVQYEWFKNDNYFKHVESDTVIPDTVTSSKSKYYPDLEPQVLELEMVSGKESWRSKRKGDRGRKGGRC